MQMSREHTLEADNDTASAAKTEDNRISKVEPWPILNYRNDT